MDAASPNEKIVREAAELGEDDEDDGAANGVEDEVFVVLFLPRDFRVAPDDFEQDEEREEEDDVDDEVEDGRNAHEDIPFYSCMRMMGSDCSYSFSLFYQMLKLRQVMEK